MDQDAFRTTYRDVNERYCAFEKAVLTNQCACSQAERFCIAEREGVHCASDLGQARCLETLALLREQARFALHALVQETQLPHGKAIRVQVGGMRGIRALIEPDAEDPDQIPDVFAILDTAIDRYGELAALPFSQIMPYLAHYEGRRRGRR